MAGPLELMEAQQVVPPGGAGGGAGAAGTAGATKTAAGATASVVGTVDWARRV